MTEHGVGRATREWAQTFRGMLDSPAGEGLTQAQMLFLAYANVWCGELRPEAARTLVETQGHSLNRYRVNNVVSNMPEFETAFGCKAGQKMANQCRVW